MAIDEETPDLAALRVSYPDVELSPDTLAATWHEQLSIWLSDAIAGGAVEPNAMVLATADPDGAPSSRTVLAKGLDERGVVFFTNFTSAKMHDLRANPAASATFPWLVLHRQAHVRGRIELIATEETVAYWRSRPRESQLGAWASPQSSTIRDRRALDASLDQVTRRFADAELVPVPPHWGGVRIRPHTVEFWQGRPDRLHDRLRYRQGDDAAWTVQRLAP